MTSSASRRLWRAAGRPSAPQGLRLYAVGDIHGRKDLLDDLLGRILADSQASAAPRKLVVFLGDLVDRGPESRAVVEALAAGPPQNWAGFRWITLRGNHEDAMLRFLDDASGGPNWFLNGGMETVASYVGEDMPRKRDPASMQAALRRALPPAHRAFLESLPLMHREGDYAFVHAGIRPGKALESQDADDLMWIREGFLQSKQRHEAVIVHGHTIVPAPEDKANRIAIDTGAFCTGRLTALAAEGDRHWFLSSAPARREPLLDLRQSGARGP